MSLKMELSGRDGPKATPDFLSDYNSPYQGLTR
jgi:hypothetical protein